MTDKVAKFVENQIDSCKLKYSNAFKKINDEIINEKDNLTPLTFRILELRSNDLEKSFLESFKTYASLTSKHISKMPENFFYELIQALGVSEPMWDYFRSQEYKTPNEYLHSKSNHLEDCLLNVKDIIESSSVDFFNHDNISPKLLSSVDEALDEIKQIKNLGTSLSDIKFLADMDTMTTAETEEALQNDMNFGNQKVFKLHYPQIFDSNRQIIPRKTAIFKDILLLLQKYNFNSQPIDFIVDLSAIFFSKPYSTTSVYNQISKLKDAGLIHSNTQFIKHK